MKKNNTNLSSMLKNADYLMVDTIDGVEFCKKNGLNKSTKIISFNPYLVLSTKYKITSPEQELPTNYYSKLSDTTREFSEKIFNKVFSYSKDNSLGIYSARYIIAVQNMIYRTSLILNLIKNSNLVIVFPDFLKEDLNKKINGDFYYSLETYNNIQTFKLKYTKEDQFQLGRDPISNFWLRLKFEGINSLLFRLFTIFCEKFNALWKGKKIVFSHENTLLKGTASYLFRKGFFIQKLSESINYENIYHSNQLNNVVNLIAPLICKYQENFTFVKINKENKLFLKSLCKKYISDYFNAKNYWKNYFNNSKNKNIHACLIGTPNGPKELSFIEVAKSNGVLTASFQHGVSKEIKSDILSIDNLYEANLVNYYFTYNKKASENSKKSRFHIAQEHIVGLPEDMRKCLRRQNFKNNKCSILYASTNLYSGNRGITVLVGSSDISKANFEIYFIENVLSKIPHAVHYKPYYSKRYAGPSPEIEIAKAKDNIHINEDEVDLRYIASSSRIIITSRATSTIGWCVVSGKPLIYIENQDSRLSIEARKEFKKNLFYFDVLEKNWDTNLHSFLSQPIEKIEKEWKTKIVFRQKFIEKYFGSQNTNAEKKCASILLKDILNMNNKDK